MRIWGDDLRTPPSRLNWHWAKTSDWTIRLLEARQRAHSVPSYMSLDHDLGGDDTTRPIVLWMCENNFWPSKVVVHSANPPGAYWLEGMIERYKA